MLSCPVCQTEYDEEQVQVCSYCEWDLTPPQDFGTMQTSEPLFEAKDWAMKRWKELSELKSELAKMSSERDRIQAQLDQLTEQRSPFRSELKQQDPDPIREDEYISDFADKKIEQEGEERKYLLSRLEQEAEERRRLQSQMEERFTSLETRLEAIEGNLISSPESHLSSSDIAPTQSQSLIVELGAEKAKSESRPVSINIHLSEEEAKLVADYNKDSDILSGYATEVSETEVSIIDRHGGSNQPAVFEKNRKGRYWLITEKSQTYIIPQGKIRINEYNYKTVQVLFECHGYQPESSKLKLLKPAKVSAMSGGEKWEIVESGVLQFE